MVACQPKPASNNETSNRHPLGPSSLIHGWMDDDGCGVGFCWVLRMYSVLSLLYGVRSTATTSTKVLRMTRSTPRRQLRLSPAQRSAASFLAAVCTTSIQDGRRWPEVVPAEYLRSTLLVLLSSSSRFTEHLQAVTGGGALRAMD